MQVRGDEFMDKALCGSKSRQASGKLHSVIRVTFTEVSDMRCMESRD